MLYFSWCLLYVLMFSHYLHYSRSFGSILFWISVYPSTCLEDLQLEISKIVTSTSSFPTWEILCWLLSSESAVSPRIERGDILGWWVMTEGIFERPSLHWISLDYCMLFFQSFSPSFLYYLCCFHEILSECFPFFLFSFLSSCFPSVCLLGFLHFVSSSCFFLPHFILWLSYLCFLLL